MADRQFDPSRRAKVKQDARDRDDCDLAGRLVSADALGRRNGFIPEPATRIALP